MIHLKKKNLKKNEKNKKKENQKKEKGCSIEGKLARLKQKLYCFITNIVWIQCILFKKKCIHSLCIETKNLNHKNVHSFIKEQTKWSLLQVQNTPKVRCNMVPKQMIIVAGTRWGYTNALLVLKRHSLGTIFVFFFTHFLCYKSASNSPVFHC